MEHKGGRIKDHVRREQPEIQDDWLDDDWLDEEEDSTIWSDKEEGIHTDAAETSKEDEHFEIEDWRDDDNWNLNRKADTKTVENGNKNSVKEGKEVQQQTGERQGNSQGTRSGSGSGKTGGGRSSGGTGSQKKRRPTQQQGLKAGNSKNTKRPVKNSARKEEGKNQQKEKDRQKKNGAARSVKTAGRVAGKAGKTAGKAVGKGLSIALKCGCFVVMAVIILELWQEFWAERSTLGEIWRVAADRNYAQGLYLGIAGVILLYGVISALWLLGGKRMPDGNRLRSYDTGRGLTAFILFAILAAGSGIAIPLIPGSPQILDGARLALTVVDRVSTVVLSCSAIGIVLCIIRKLLGR